MPVFNAQGQAVAALNGMSQTNRVQEDYLVQQILPLLRNTANELKCNLNRLRNSCHQLELQEFQPII